MSTGPEKIPRAVWFYAGILTLSVLVLWSFFWKKEFRFLEVKDNHKSLGAIVNELTSSMSQGKAVINQLAQDITGLKATPVSPVLVNQLLGQVEITAWQKRVADWPEWTNQDFSFKLPPGWRWHEENDQFIISSFDDSLSLLPSARAEIKINFLDNPLELNPEEWWTADFPSELNSSPVTSTTEIIDNLEGLKKIIEDNPNSSISYSEFIFIPLEKRMLELSIDITGDYQQFQQTAADFKKTIKIY